MKYVIDNDIPAPATNPGGPHGRVAKYPFSAMQPGESVWIDGATTRGREYMAAQAIGRTKGWQFSGRTEGAGLRVWRIA